MQEVTESIDTSSAIFREDTMLMVLGMTNLFPHNWSATALELWQIGDAMQSWRIISAS